MKCLKARINWMKGYANGAHLECLVDRFPDHSELRYERRGDIWFAEKDGYVSFYEWKGPHKEQGFGGRTFDLIMKDGSKAALLGPWDVEKNKAHSQGFTFCIGASLTDDPKVMVQGHTFYSCTVTREWAQAVLDEFLPDVEIRQDGSVLHGQNTPFDQLKPFYAGAEPLNFHLAMKGKTVEESKKTAPTFLPLRSDGLHEAKFKELQKSAERQGFEIARVCRKITPLTWAGRSFLEAKIGAVRNGKVIRLAKICWSFKSFRIKWTKRRAADFVPYSEEMQWEKP